MGKLLNNNNVRLFVIEIVILIFKCNTKKGRRSVLIVYGLLLGGEFV